MPGDKQSFHLEIDGIEEFAAFVALIRGHELTPEPLKALMAKMEKSRENLAAAEAESK